MTKQEALENHRKMWNWIADKTLERKRKVWKRDYFNENGIDIKDKPFNNCYCCEYDSQFEECNSCAHCPIDWGNENNFCDTTGYIYENNFCDTTTCIYDKWMLECDDYLKAAQYARTIANLPEREEV